MQLTRPSPFLQRSGYVRLASVMSCTTHHTQVHYWQYVRYIIVMAMCKTICCKDDSSFVKEKSVWEL